ncbi:fibronectin type III domain-containing protein [Cytobacillus purgationiresistens]|uniref:Fibronectin type-III domain-containing protein n=1 Tax=Cytobacillus purgationiresistens TaxID=863449 RepID=A0ABU0ACU1_9BACI|nr:fibronectin type III domain-containing protein [Cytobacillus purgationiresistens]MDQ0268860.1 hypothetical protein [Cytobacillus purgationiresistens]
MLKKILLFLSFCFFFANSNNILAESNWDITVSPTDSTIKLSWNEVGYEYEIYLEDYKQDVLIWEGKENKHTINNLEPDHIYKYKIVAYNEKKEIIDFVRVNTATNKIVSFNKGAFSTLNNVTGNQKSNEEVKESILNDATVEAVIGKDEVKFTWGNLPNDYDTYEVYKNAELVGQVSAGEYIDKNIEPGKEYSYEFRGYKKLSEKEISELKEKAEEENVKFNSKQEKELSKKPYSIGYNIKTLEDNLEDNIKKNEVELDMNINPFSAGISPAIEYRPGYILIYKTFIPMNRAPNPISKVSKYKTFHGDGRVYPNFFSDQYRTKSTVAVIFGPKTRFLHLEKDVSRTYGYDAKGKQNGSAKEPNTGMKLTNTKTGSDWASYTYKHAVKIPLIVSPPIDYDYTAKIYKNGSYRIEGYHDTAPSHELHIGTYPGDSRALVFFDKHRNFFDLFGIGINYVVYG